MERSVSSQGGVNVTGSSWWCVQGCAFARRPAAAYTLSGLGALQRFSRSMAMSTPDGGLRSIVWRQWESQWDGEIVNLLSRGCKS